MHAFLVALVWVVAATLALAGVGYVALRWIALSIARRVAEAAERRLASSLHRGMQAAGLAREDRSRSTAADSRMLAQIDRLAWLMDRLIPLPFVGGVGLDAAIGLVPVVGDLLSFAVSSLIVVRAAQLGLSTELLTRLVAIQCTDLLLSAVPVLGDLMDVAYQADVKSAALIRAALAASRGTTGTPRATLVQGW
jgi:hypothetical protein